MPTTNIPQFYNQARHWSDVKLDRHLLARSTGNDTPLVLALTLAKISRVINTQNRRSVNVLENPKDLLSYLIEESTHCAISDKEVLVQILFSIAERYLEECDYVEREPIQAVLRAAAQISNSFASNSLSRINALRTLERISKTILPPPFAANSATRVASKHQEPPVSQLLSIAKSIENYHRSRIDSQKRQVTYEKGGRIVCSVEESVPGGYKVSTQNGIAGYVLTEDSFQIKDQLVAVIEQVKEERVLLHLPGRDVDTLTALRLALHILLLELGRLKTGSDCEIQT